MKKYISNFFRKKAGKRFVSGLTAFVMVFCALPAAEIGEKLSELVFTSITAKAESEPPSNYRFKHDSDNKILLSIQDFYDYAESIKTYPSYHQNDKITIQTSSGITQYYQRGFAGLGTSESPFSGSISIEQGKTLVLNLDAPLFNFVTDTAVLNNGDELKISRFYGKIPSGQSKVDTTPLLAKNVIAASGTKAVWNVSVEKPSATDEASLAQVLDDFGGMIGTMGTNAKLTLNVTMDQQEEDMDPIEMKSTSNLGLACGLLKTGAELSFSIGASAGKTIRNVTNISTTSGNVGGLVGEMESNSKFTFTGSNIQNVSANISTAKDGYAGGIVGKIDKATVVMPSSSAYDIAQLISGTKGTGAIYGYYQPKSNETSIDLTKYRIDDTNAAVNGTGHIGGLFGVLECDHNYEFTANAIVKSKHTEGDASSYGGLIGKYSNTLLINTLSIGGLTTSTNLSSGKATYYGGAIGIIDDTNASYVKFDGFTVNKAYNAGSLTFGGLCGKAAKAFVDANNVTIKVNGTFAGGGLVGDLGDGVLRMTGTTDLSSAKSKAPTSEAHNYGQIVGFRGNALIFAETGWKLQRSDDAVSADDIGAWGEVIRFNAKSTDTITETDDETGDETSYNVSYEQFGSGNTVLTVNETAHTVTIDGPVYTIGSVADFAKTALNIKLSSSDIVTAHTVSGTLTLSGNINLSGTGITGFTRDNNKDNSFIESHCVYNSNFMPSGFTVTLAIGEAYGFRGENDLSTAETRSDGDGRIYNHRYNGLFGILNGSEVGNASDAATKKSTINGTVSVYPTANSVYVGALAAVVKKSAKIYALNVTTEFDYGGNKSIYLGRLVGEVNQPDKNTTSKDYALRVQGIVVSGNVTGGNSDESTCIGGVIGKIYHTSNEVQNWRFQNLTISGKIENTAEKTNQIIGGLIAMISGYSATKDFNARTLTLTKITTNNLEISAGKSTSMGGLLGYQWLNTDAVVGLDSDNIVKIDSGSKITASDAVKDMAGLVYNATGKWTVNKLDISSINVAANNPRSFGMIVNKGWYCDSGKNYKTDGSSSAIYLLLPTTTCYSISSSTLTSLNNASVFDELVAYSAYYTDSGDTRSGVDDSGDEYILKNGAGVVSIKTTETNGLNMNGSTASKSYQAQTSQGAKPNPWTRYYYNLDTVTSNNSENLSTAQKKLMSWGLNQYAHQSIRSSFANPFSNNEIASATYDMNGYSWYPVDVDNNVKVQGIFKFYNYEFEESEKVNGGTNNSQKTSLYNNTKNSTTQHYLLHAGLLRNVYTGKTVTVNTVALQGNTPVINGYSGALICGTIDGASDTNKAVINIDGLDLDGVYIHNITNVTGDSKTYAPLVINKILKYTNLTAKNVKTTNKYTTDTSANVPYIKKDGTYPKAASSLIGEVGSSTAKGLNLNFTMMKLDGRTTSVDNTNDENTALDTAYGTNRTIFTKATLLDKFEFESGSTGTYTYTWANDWGSDGRYVTYGKEVGYTTEGEYPNLERKYIEGSTDSAEEFTSPISNADTNGNYMNTNKNNFLPYVATAYGSTTTTHQLEVNHRTTTAEGCGTYNDPYMIQSSTDLENFAKILNANYDGTSVTLPSASERTVYWCEDKSGKTHHKLFSYSGGSYVCEGEKPLSTTVVRTYLAGAYYKLGKNVELNSTYPGLSSFTSISTSGATQNDFAVFRGVIDGGDFTITNKSSSPLIGNSYGSVVRNLTISVQSTNNILLTQSNNSDKFPTCKSYGGVIANVLGGDNILEKVSVTFSSMSSNIDLAGDYSQIIPVGGYIGTVVNGAVIFKNMTSAVQGLSTLPSGKINKTVTIEVFNEDTEQTITEFQRTPISISDKQWLYVNPIIGRVLNGYAVTEGSDYVTSENDVTMHNSTKNYSIADIKKTEANKLSTGAYTTVTGASTMYSTDVSIPNAQAWFVMSLLTQSSTTVGAPTALTAVSSSDSYGKTYHRMRNAAYSAVGTPKAKADISDYTLAAADHGTSGVPFLVKNYTDVIDGTTNYGVLALTNNNTVCNFKLGGTETVWTLPDGYRGIGNIGFGVKSSQDDYLKARTISLHKFSGKSNNGSGSAVTITMNMSLQHYESSFDNYLPVNNSKGGFGLFDTLRHNRFDQGAKTDAYKISDLNITGKIDYYVFFHDTDDGSAIYIGNNVNNVAYLNTGGVAGYAGFADADSITVETIGVSGLTVNGFETAGGFFGNLQLANHNTNHLVSISKINADTAFTVTSKRYSGGILGYFKQGNLNINDVKIKLPNVLTEYQGNAYQDFENGVGGVIGFAQTADKNAPIIMYDITLGQENTDINSRIGYKEGLKYYRYNEKNGVENGNDSVVAGGIIGRSHTIKSVTENGITYSLKLEKCNVYNISVYGHRVGGLIGSDTSGASYLAFLNCNVKNDKNAVIKSATEIVPNENNIKGKNPPRLEHRACSGIIGGLSAKNAVVDNCSVVGYKMWGFNDTAGVCANISAGPVQIRNFLIKDIIFISNYSAALAGWLPTELSGYNIICDNLQFQDRTGGTTENTAGQHGYLVSKNNLKKIKIVGLSCKNTTAKPGYFIPSKFIGTNDYSTADNNYIVFADYNGAASDGNKTFSDVDTGATNVKDYKNQVVTDNNPYVTSSPKMYIGDEQFLTGDVLSSVDKDKSAFSKIIEDKQNPQKSNPAQSYQKAPSVNNSLVSAVKEHLTTSKEEFGSSFPYDFPMLVVEDTDITSVTNYINYYIQNLTNSPPTFTFQQDKSNVYKVVLRKCTYANGKFEVAESGTTASLKRFTTGFQLDTANIDNADPNTPQFTLMDVQFLNPSSAGQVAYHLYIPIYGKRLIQYTFGAKLASGTNYYSGAYSSINTGNTLFENLGNPVTMRIEYNYDRELTDWADAINGGENVYKGSNFYKDLLLSMKDTTGWAPDSRLVLVDATNNDKHYYKDAAITEKDSKDYYHIAFDSFTTDGTAQGTPFKPAPLNDLLTLSIALDGNGKLMQTTEDKATVKVGDNYYKNIEAGDSPPVKYTVTVTDVKPEVYYLSFFTNKNSGSTNIYHYEIRSAERFAQHATNNSNWQPNKVVAGNDNNKPVHLFIGNLYTNDQMELTVTPRVASTYKMSKSNNLLTVTMTAHVGLTETALTDFINKNLENNPSSTIYQTFLMNYDVAELTDSNTIATKIGVDTSAISSILVTDYTIYSGSTVPETVEEKEAKGTSILPLSDELDPEKNMTSNYIELRNKVNLNPYLRDSNNAYTATIQVTFAVEYSEGNLSKQFAKRTVENDARIGSMVRGYSNISSVAENGAYSATSLPVSDVKNNKENRYYITDLASATLTYNAEKTMTSPDGQYSSLGINPFDEGTKNTNKGHIDSTATYSYLDLQDPGDYIEFNLTLTSKKDGYNATTPLDIRQYFQNLTIKADKNDTTALYTQGTGTSDTNVVASMSADGKTITLRAHKNSLHKVADKVYSIYISFDVLTGETNGFGTTKAYSNYKVNLTADMYGSIDTTATPDTQPHASDHIIYTNSKLQYKMI